MAVAVIAAISVWKFNERLHEFPGMGEAKKLLVIAGTTRMTQLDALQTDAGALGDFFFMKHRLDHYDVPPEFASLKAVGVRVFDDEDGTRVAQIATDKHIQLFLFPAERDPKTGKSEAFEGWRWVDHEGWTGAVIQRNAVCFMAAVRGERTGRKELASYVPRTIE
jgi:hypothetical protein